MDRAITAGFRPDGDSPNHHCRFETRRCCPVRKQKKQAALLPLMLAVQPMLAALMLPLAAPRAAAAAVAAPQARPGQPRPVPTCGGREGRRG